MESCGVMWLMLLKGFDGDAAPIEDRGAALGPPLPMGFLALLAGDRAYKPLCRAEADGGLVPCGCGAGGGFSLWRRPKGSAPDAVVVVDRFPLIAVGLDWIGLDWTALQRVGFRARMSCYVSRFDSLHCTSLHCTTSTALRCTSILFRTPVSRPGSDAMWMRFGCYFDCCSQTKPMLILLSAGIP